MIMPGKLAMVVGCGVSAVALFVAFLPVGTTASREPRPPDHNVHIERGNNYAALLREGWLEDEQPIDQLALKGRPGLRTTYWSALSLANQSPHAITVCLSQAPGSGLAWSFAIGDNMWNATQTSAPIQLAPWQRVQADLTLDWWDMTVDQTGFTWEIHACN